MAVMLVRVEGTMPSMVSAPERVDNNGSGRDGGGNNFASLPFRAA